MEKFDGNYGFLRNSRNIKGPIWFFENFWSKISLWISYFQNDPIDPKFHIFLEIRNPLIQNFFKLKYRHFRSNISKFFKLTWKSRKYNYLKPFQLLIVVMKSTLRIIQHQVTLGQSLLEKSHNLKFLTSSFGSKKRLCTTIHTLKAIWLKWLFLSILLSYLDSVVSVFSR